MKQKITVADAVEMAKSNPLSSQAVEFAKEHQRIVTLYELLFKRAIDITGALTAILILSPILILVAILVRIKHGRGIIFKQKRVGRGRKVFTVYKFRSMSNKCDQNGDLLPDKDRITNFGKFIRKTSLDELPQLFNVLKGDMSLIGPRPKDVKECVFFNNEQCGRYAVRPGVTGLQQVNGRNSLDFEGVVKYDLKYVHKITFLGDMIIFFKTFWVVLAQKDIDSNNQSANNFCFMYNDLLLQRGDITRGEYDRRIAFSKTLKVGQIMPTIDEQRAAERSGSGLTHANEMLQASIAAVREEEEMAARVG
jgi:lipopolysaccharide/colanic/teichoic acid biosynthesis glycosyltransferase